MDKPRSHWPLSILSTASSVFNVLTPLFLVRVFSVEEIGLFKLFFLYFMLVPSFTLGPGILNGISYWVGQKDLGQKVLQFSNVFLIVSGVLLSAIGLIFRDMFAEFLDWPVKYIDVFIFAIAFGPASSYLDELAVAKGRIWFGALFTSTSEVIRTTLIVSVAFIFKDLYFVFLVHAMVIFLKSMIGFIWGLRQFPFSIRFEMETFKSLLKYSFPVSIAGLCGVLLSYPDQLILSRFLSKEEFAFFSVGCLAVSPLFLFEYSVVRVLIPQMAEAFGVQKISQSAFYYKRAVEELATYLIPAATGLMVFSPAIIVLLFTEKYAPAIPYLSIYAISYAILIIPYDSVARAKGQSRWIFHNAWIFAAISLSFTLVMSYLFGATGALSAALMTRFLRASYSVYYVRKDTGWSLGEFIPSSTLLRILVTSFLLGLFSWLLRPLFPSDLIWFLLTGPVFTALYFIFTIPWLNLRHLSHHPNKTVLVVGTGNLFDDFQSNDWAIFRQSVKEKQGASKLWNIARSIFSNDIQIVHCRDKKALIVGRILQAITFKKFLLLYEELDKNPQEADGLEALWGDAYLSLKGKN